MGGGKSASRFSDCHQICQSLNLPADLVIAIKSASQYSCWQKWQGVNLPADLVTVTKSASLYIYWQKWGGKSASIFSNCQQICQSVHLLAEMAGGKSASRLSDCQQIWQSVHLLAEMGGVNLSVSTYAGKNGGNLMADLVTVTKSASQYICWQKWEGKSAGKFSDCQ